MPTLSKTEIKNTPIILEAVVSLRVRLSQRIEKPLKGVLVALLFKHSKDKF